MSSPYFQTRPGERLPAGSTPTPEGVNFSVFSRNATRMDLLLYRDANDPVPLQVIHLDPGRNRTYFFWHVFVEGAPIGIYYTWRADGRADTRLSGARFDPKRELLDPWAKEVAGGLWRRYWVVEDPGVRNVFRGRVVDDAYDWEGDRPIDHAFEDSIIYEVHVGGFTKDPSSGVAHPGTFRGLVEKIPYLKSLGVTDVELMPVMAFDPDDIPESTARLGLTNYWGYSPYGFYAPHPGFSSSSEARREFRDMVKALHRAGLGVILDVVFNHTAEDGEDGPIIHFKGLANETFYHLDPADRRRYRDYTGCGNTLNCNHPVVVDFLVRCLEYWVREMHVDGFRFDLASVLTRGEDGAPMVHAPAPWAIEFSPVLAHAKLIAEAWDAHGLFQVGDFPGFRWMEWNSRYRDTARRAVRGDEGIIRDLATRIGGSSDLHEGKGKSPITSINFFTCHDGFTLWDLVSYNRKHNEANGEDNRDGSNDNLSWNCGVEGPTDDPAILALRKRQARNHLALLLVSQGLPMLLAGDEVLRTQHGNNNAYCQDNPISWMDWSLMEKNADVLRFTREMIALRRRHRALRRRQFLTGKPKTGRAGQPDIVWHGLEAGRPDWNNPASRVLGFTLAGQENDGSDVHVLMNFSPVEKSLPVPPAPGQSWHRAVDTSLPPPKDILPPETQVPFRETSYPVAPHSIVILESR